MTADTFVSIVFKVAGSVALSAVVVYYSYKMAEGLIRKRKRYIKRLKKSHAFQAFNGEQKIQVVQKNGKKVAKA